MIETGIGGSHLRATDPDWHDPLDASYAKANGGRWNAPGSFPVLYLNADMETARANVQAKYVGLPYGPEDLDPISAPLLVEVSVPEGVGCELRTDDGLAAVGLPVTYPHDDKGVVVWEHCQKVGQDVHDRGMDGIACRSAAPDGDEELAWFPLDGRPEAQAGDHIEFAEWYYGSAAPASESSSCP